MVELDESGARVLGALVAEDIRDYIKEYAEEYAAFLKQRELEKAQNEPVKRRRKRKCRSP